MQVLRDYQLEAADAVMGEFAKGVRATAVVWATGLGKTTLAAEVIRRFQPLQTLFLCERKELVEQAAARIEQHTGIECGVERGEHRVSVSDLFGDVGRPIVATIQSLNSAWGQYGKRMHKFKPKLVVVDEFHHAVAPQYEYFFNYVGPETNLFGLSATPKRHDKKGHRHFQSVAHKFEMREAIAAGWLCEISQEFIKVKGLDYSKIRTVRGDLDPKELARVMEEEQTIQRMCQPSLEIVYGIERESLLNLPPDQWGNFLENNGHEPFRTIMFCASVRHAEMAAEVFNRSVKGISRMICGKTAPEDREEIMKDFRAGKFPIITNCAVLGEGVDVPEVEVILQGRATKSAPVWQQQFGRGTRTLPGVIDGLSTPEERRAAIAASKKRFVRVVDFVGNSGKHHLISSIDILGGDMSPEVKRRAMEDALAKGKPVNIAVTLSNAEKSVKHEKAQEERRKEEERKRHLVAGVGWQGKEIDPFGKDKQAVFYNAKPQQKDPIKPKQANLLGRCGVYPVGLSQKQAGMIIGILAKNNWKLPNDPKYDWIRNRRPK